MTAGSADAAANTIDSALSPAIAGPTAAAGDVGLNDLSNVAGLGKQGLSLFSAQSQQTTPPIGQTQLQAPTGGGAAPPAPAIADATAAPPGAPLVPPPAQPGTSAASSTSGNAAWGSGPVDTSGNNLTTDSGGALSGLLDFANKNPVVTLGALQSAGSLLSGAFSTLTPAQVNALNGQAAANNAAASLTTQQVANLAAPKAVASSAPVTGTPQTLVPPPTSPAIGGQAAVPQGFINQAPRPAVTGAPA